MIETIGIIGHTGFVGKNVFRWFTDRKFEVYGYSLDDTQNETKAYGADVVFVCVPTPFDWNTRKYDGSIVEKTLEKIESGKIVVIKSTVKIGTTEKLQKQFPNLKILFNPEFLSEATAWTDFINPDRQFVGFTDKSYRVATEVLNMLPESAYDVIMPSKEAELLKYVNNIHGIIEIMESNHYYDICQLEGLDYERMIKAATASKWVGCPMGRHYRVIYHKGKRGAGGHCFPKDLNAFIEYCHENKIDASLFEGAKAYNDKLLDAQGLSEEIAEQIGSEEDAKKFIILK